MQQKKLPMKAISTLLNVTTRILKTHRNFIVSVMVIINEKYQLINGYLLEAEDR